MVSAILIYAPQASYLRSCHFAFVKLTRHRLADCIKALHPRTLPPVYGSPLQREWTVGL